MVKEDFSTELTGKDENTGSITWKVKYAPDINRIIKDMNTTMKDIKKISNGNDDEGLKQLYSEYRNLRNTIRTYFRKNYPDRYGKLKETTTTGSTGQHHNGGYKIPKKFKSKLVHKIKLWEKEKNNK